MTDGLTFGEMENIQGGFFTGVALGVVIGTLAAAVHKRYKSDRNKSKSGNSCRKP